MKPNFTLVPFNFDIERITSKIRVQTSKTKQVSAFTSTTQAHISPLAFNHAIFHQHCIMAENSQMKRAEIALKKSLECAISKEENDYFNGNFTKDDLAMLKVRLINLQKNISLKGKLLKEVMCDPQLLDVLEKKVIMLLMRLEAYEEARHPTKNNKLQANLQGPFIVLKVNQFGIVEVKQLRHGRIHQVHGHKFIYFKDNFKPP